MCCSVIFLLCTFPKGRKAAEAIPVFLYVGLPIRTLHTLIVRFFFKIRGKILFFFFLGGGNCKPDLDFHPDIIEKFQLI